MKKWLNNAVVYEIYPQSFYDTNGDGIGDLQGIIEKLDYIHECGFTAIWLNPINESSFRDAGYDVTDFYSVAKRYGTLEDYRQMCAEAHKRGMKVVFDLVAGHTSIDHPWFIASGKVEQNEYTNRYIWTTSAFDPGPGIASLGERDAKVIENFFWSQPALNYGYAHPNPENPWELPVTHPDCVAMKEELKRIIAFWMDLGTDAFRVDMAASLIKGDTDGSCMKAFWHEIKAFMEAKDPESTLIAEWGDPKTAIDSGFDLDFLLHGNKAYDTLLRHEKGRNTFSTRVGHSYFSRDGKGNINDFLDEFLVHRDRCKGKGRVGLITGNHDIPRLGYRRTPEEIKAAMVLIFTMAGVPFVYYGDEIGMDYIPGLPSKEGGYIRTGSRTPMQWNSEKNHGFSDSDTPYLPTDSKPDAPTVEQQLADPDSVLNFVKQLIAYHKENPALWADSELEILNPGYPFVYTRSSGDKKVLIAIDPSDGPHYCAIPAFQKTVFSRNTQLRDGLLVTEGVSFLVAEL